MTTRWIRILLILPLLFLFATQVVLAQSYSGAKALMEKADRCADTCCRPKRRKELRHKWTECVDAYRERGFPGFLRAKEAGGLFLQGAKLQESLFGVLGKPQDLDGAIELYRRVATSIQSSGCGRRPIPGRGDYYQRKERHHSGPIWNSEGGGRSSRRETCRPKAQQMV